jgi:small subunit ribosomal protein S4
MIRKHKKFDRPRRLYDKRRILDENKLVEKYGLKNKREIWKMEAKVKYFRSRAKDLITAPHDEQKHFFAKLNTIGLKVKTIADVLALDKEDLMKRRLSTIVAEKRIGNTPKHARQMIVHKKIMIGGTVVNVPGYFVRVDEEDSIKLRKKVATTKIEKAGAEQIEEKAEGIANE